MKLFYCFTTLILHFSLSAQVDSVLEKKANRMFEDEFGKKGQQLIYSRSPIMGIRDFDYSEFKSKMYKTNYGFDYYFRYKSALHNDGFWYEVNFDSLENSMYYFANREYVDSIGSFFDETSYKIEAIESSKLEFIDSLVVTVKDRNHTIYKFKTTHVVENLYNVCMLHFISDTLGLVARQSNRWLCAMKTPEGTPEELIFCPYVDRNHFSILNVSDSYYRRERFMRKPIKTVRPDWIVKALRIGIPKNSEILAFYNDVISCNCGFEDVISGHLAYIARGGRPGLSYKQIKQKNKQEKKYYKTLEREKRLKSKEKPVEI